jgi:hypothetical protein
MTVLELVLRVRGRQGQQEIGGGGETRLDAGLCAAVAQGDRQMGLAHPAGADQHDVLVALDKGQTGQFVDLARLTPAAKA